MTIEDRIERLEVMVAGLVLHASAPEIPWSEYEGSFDLAQAVMIEAVLKKRGETP